MITAPVDMLDTLLQYDPTTGSLVWKERNRNLSGKEAGGVCKRDGYRRIRVDGKTFLAHRLILAMTSRNWPSGQVDHINGNRSDNRLENLRPVPQGENLLNKARYRNNSSGAIGVHWHKQHLKWYAGIQQSGRSEFIGLFEHLPDAVAARKSAERQLGFHQNHGREKS